MLTYVYPGRIDNYLRVCSLYDSGELVSLKRRAADKTAVNVLLSKKLFSIAVVHGATVLNNDLVSCLSTVELSDALADNTASLVCLLRGSGKAGTDCPYGLVCDNNVLKLVSANACKVELGLKSNNLVGNTGESLLLNLTEAKDNLKASCKSKYFPFSKF